MMRKTAKTFATTLFFLALAMPFLMNFVPVTAVLSLETKMSAVIFLMALAFVASTLLDIADEGLIFTLSLKFQATIGLCVMAAITPQLVRGEVVGFFLVFAAMLCTQILSALLYARKNGISVDKAFDLRKASISAA